MALKGFELFRGSLQAFTGLMGICNRTYSFTTMVEKIGDPNMDPEP